MNLSNSPRLPQAPSTQLEHYSLQLTRPSSFLVDGRITMHLVLPPPSPSSRVIVAFLSVHSSVVLPNRLSSPISDSPSSDGRSSSMLLILLGGVVLVRRGGLKREELGDDLVRVFLEEGEFERVEVVGRAVEGDP